MRRPRFVMQPGRRPLQSSAAARATAAGSIGVPEPRTIRPVQSTYRRYVMPATKTPAEDPVHNAYNDYLVGLAADDLVSDQR